MRSSTCYFALLAASTLASPVLQQRDHSKGVFTSQHSHLEYHLIKARQKFAARALAAGDNSAETPAENVLEELDDLFGESQGEGPSDAWHVDEPQSQPQAQAQPLDLPPPEIIITEYLTTCISTNSASPSTTSVVLAPTTTQVQPQANSDEQSAEQQAAANEAAEAKAAQQKAAAEKAAADKAAAEKAAQQQQQQQNQASQTQPNPPPQTQPKPQPTQHEPPADSSPASSVSTDGLPTEFVPNLDTESAIYQGLAKQHHDIHRKNHSLNALAWNDTLFGYAKETATSCIYGHSL